MNCLLTTVSSGNTICDGCQLWSFEKVKVRKSRWRASSEKYKCEHGAHTEEFYKNVCQNNVAMANPPSNESRKRSGDRNNHDESPKQRRMISYCEKDSNEFKVAANMMDGSVDLEFTRLEFNGALPTNRGRGRPRKEVNSVANASILRRCEELKVLLARANQERQNMIAQAQAQTAAMEILQAEKAASVAAAAITYERARAADDVHQAAIQAQTRANMVAAANANERARLADVARLKAQEDMAAAAHREITTVVAQMEQPSTPSTPVARAEPYPLASLYNHLNSFWKGRGKWAQHAVDLLNMKPLRQLLIGLVIVILRQTLFTRNKWARAVDMKHGLNLGGIEVIREMECLPFGCQGLVWSSGTVKNVHRAIEKHMMTKVSFKLIGEVHQDVWVDGVTLDVKELLIYLIKHYGLEEKARSCGCEIAITVDGAKLDEYCGHVTCGFKITDRSARDPLIIDETDPAERGVLCYHTMQSESKQIPISSVIAKDNKATYDRFFSPIFAFAHELRTVGIPELGYKPFRVSEPQDMKSSQICMGRGGAAKQVAHFCHLCHKHSDDLARPNQVPCVECIKTQGKQCFCYPVMDAEVIAKLVGEKDALDKKNEAQRLSFVCEAIYGGEWIEYYRSCDLHLVPIGDKPSIHDMPPSTDRALMKAYLDRVASTLSTLGIVCAAETRLSEKRVRIVKALRVIAKYAHYHDAIMFRDSVKNSVSCVDDQIFCILHLHKRIIEKVICLLFTRSLDEISGGTKAARVSHIRKLQLLVNRHALGKENKPGRWKCAIKNEQEIGDCRFSDGQAKEVEVALPRIIEEALTLEKSKKPEWLLAVRELTVLLASLGQRDDFTDADILVVQQRVESWALKWIDLVGKEGMTNYTHCLVSGHVVYYLKRWRNLYRYSNQGWEYFNSQYRYVYNHRTQRGGSSGTHGESGSKMKPIGLWFLRRLYWLTTSVDAKVPGYKYKE